MANYIYKLKYYRGLCRQDGVLVSTYIFSSGGTLNEH